MRDKVAVFAGALRVIGVGRGDTVIIYMPMIPEAVVAMLACARLGAIHSVVFGGFAANELALRIDHAKPKVIVSASGAMEGKKTLAYKPLLDKAMELADHKVEKCVIFQRPFVEAALNGGRDLDWQALVATAAPVDCVMVKATDPLYILYTSGTTGMPKGVIRDNGGHAVALHWSMKYIYGVAPGRCLLGGLGCRLGSRALLYRLCPAAHGLHHGALRGQTGRHPRPRRILAGDRAA